MSSRGKTQKRRQDQARQAANRARQAEEAAQGTESTPDGESSGEVAATSSTSGPTTPSAPATGSTANRPASQSTKKPARPQPAAAGGGRPPATRPGGGQRPPRRPAPRKRQRDRRLLWAGAAGAIIVVVAIILVFALSGGGGSNSAFPSTTGPEGAPIPKAPPLATTATKATGKTVDGIQCQTNEQTVYHVHSHLSVFVNGHQRQIPYGIGIPGAVPQQTAQGVFISSGTCFYWLHTHASDGIIHIESPSNDLSFHLGQFFNIWGQPLTSDQIGPAKGKITAFLNGKLFTGNLQDIPLGAHNVIQIDVGKVVSPQPFTFPAGL